MKQGTISIYVLIYFLGSLLYILLVPDNHDHGKANFYTYLRVSYYILQYFLTLGIAKFGLKYAVNVDRFALKFVCIFATYKLIFFSLIINNDLPTYISIVDSKLVSIGVSLFLFIVSFIIWFKRFNLKKWHYARRL